MRMLVLPAALLLGAALYSLFPAFRGQPDRAIRALMARCRRLFTTRRGRTEEHSALAVALLALAASVILVGAMHPAVAALVMAPLFSGFFVLPQGAAAKQALSAGECASDPAAYERRVLDACRPMGDAFAREVVVPMLLCAVGLPLHIGSALAWVYAALRLAQENAAAQAICRGVDRAGDRVLGVMLLLCAGLFGRNPLRVGGSSAGERLMRILSLEGEVDHAPISGDISQGAFLCCLCTTLICLPLTGVGALLIR